MKLKSFLFLLLFLICQRSNSQNIYLSDTIWRNYLLGIGLNNCIVGDSLDISCPQLATITDIELNQSQVLDLTGLEYFVGLKNLKITNCSLSYLPPLPDSLTNLNVFYNSNLTSLPSLPSALTTLYCENNSLTGLPLLPSGLMALYVSSNPINSLGQLPQSLILLNCSTDGLSSLPSLPPNLRYLNCSGNQLTSLPPLPSQLYLLDFQTNYITSLPAIPSSLRDLRAWDNQLTGLPALPDSLETLVIGKNNFSSIDSFPRLLDGLNCSFNNLTSLPPFPSAIREIIIGHNNISVLPAIPNTVTDLFCNQNNIAELPELPRELDNLCIEDNPISCLPPVDFVRSFRMHNTSITCLPNYFRYNTSDVFIDTIPLCQPSSSCPVNWSIAGNVYQDNNSNCVFDSLERNLKRIPVILDSAGVALQMFLSNASGSYSFRAPLGNYNIILDSTVIPFDILCPQNGIQMVSLTPTDSLVDSVDFSLSCNLIPDYIANSISPMSIIRPNHVTLLFLNAGEKSQNYNGNCFNDSGRVIVTINGSAQYTSSPISSLTPDYQSIDSLVWNIANFSQIDPQSAFNINVLVDSLAQSGDSVLVTLRVSGSSETNLTNNILSEYLIVRTSFDPNIKTISPERADTSTHEFTFTIYFQNTGTISAENIFIVDTLDNDLDPATFEFIASSHNVVSQMLNGNVLRFNYNNINLIDSTTNELLSHGFYKFKISRKQNTSAGTEISNTARIYFDFNAPIVTNSVSLIIESILTIGNNVANNLSQLVFPNPAQDRIVIECENCSDVVLKIYDVTGRNISMPFDYSMAGIVINIQSLNKGLYFFELKNGKEIFKGRFLKK